MSTHRVVVKGIPVDTSEQDEDWKARRTILEEVIVNAFSKYGKMDSIKFVPELGTALVTFGNAVAKVRALNEMRGMKLATEADGQFELQLSTE